jgi:TRAP transporter 4TM/12TM fusion protein
VGGIVLIIASKMVSVIKKVLSICMIAWAVFYVVDIYGFISGETPIRIFVYEGQFLSLFLLFGLTLTFLHFPAKRGTAKRGVPLHDLCLIAASAVGLMYIFVNWTSIAGDAFYRATTIDIVLGIITSIAILEATRRTVGLTVTIIVVIFFIYPLISSYLPGPFEGRGYSIQRIIEDYYLGTLGIFGTPLRVISTVVCMFILFGAFLEVTGAGKFFINLALSLVGRFRGGPAKVAVMASAFMGSITGIASGNVAATGSITIPMMKRLGYKPEFAAAVESAASTGGVVLPPVMGAVAFLIANFLGTTYDKVIIAAALPAILYYLAIYWQVDFRSAKTGLRGLPKNEIPSKVATLKEGWVYIVPFAALIFLLVVWRWEPSRVAVYSVVILILFGLVKKESRINFSKLVDGLEGAATAMLRVISVVAAVGILVQSVYVTGLAGNISNILVDFSGGNLAILVALTIVASLIFGMGMGVITIYITLATLVAPALVEPLVGAGWNPMDAQLAAHLFVMYYGVLSYITPPMCPAVWVASAIAGSKPMSTGWQAVRLGIVAYLVPIMFIYSPSLLMVGPAAEITLAVITGIIGVIGLASGIEGYLIRPMSWFWRVLAFWGGVLLIYPTWITDIVGLGTLAVVAGFQIWKLRQAGGGTLAIQDNLGDPFTTGSEEEDIDNGEARIVD